MLFGSKRRIQVTLVTHGVSARMFKAGSYDLAEGARVKTLLDQAGPAPRGVPLVILIHGERTEPGRRLDNGDEVTVLQFAAGG